MLPVAAIDTETDLIGRGNQFPDLICGSFCVDGGSGAVVLPPAQTVDYTATLLDNDCMITGVNLAFDFGVLARAEPSLLPKIFAKYRKDQITGVDVRQRLIDNSRGLLGFYPGPAGKLKVTHYGLAALAEQLLGVHVEKVDTWRLRYSELKGIHPQEWPQEALDYAMADTVIPARMHALQERHAGLLLDQYRQARGAWWLELTSGWGAHTDARQVRLYLEEIEKDFERIRAELQLAGLVRLDGSKNQKYAQHVMQRAPFPQSKLDADACALSGDPLLVKYAEYAGMQTKRSRALELLDSPVHTHFNPFAESGRTTSAGPNIQNRAKSSPEHWPAHVGDRQCFVSRPGTVLAIADYSAFELSALAQVCYTLFGRSRLRDLINDGEDPHVYMGSHILEVSFDSAKKQYKAGDKKTKDARQLAKVPNFGLPGGLGAEAFVAFARANYGITLTVERAKELKRIWLRAFPEMKLYFDFINRQLRGRKAAPIEQLFTGRLVMASYTKACNTLFQGLAADGAKMAGFLIAEACYVDQASPLFGSRIVNFGHDEFQVETPDADLVAASAAAWELSEQMVLGAKVFMPDVRVSAEPLLAYHWGKQNETILDPQGNILPCDTRDMPRIAA